MCNNIKVLSKGKSGELSLCTKSDIYHLVFNNIYLEFNAKEFNHFKNYILSLEIEYWEQKYAHTNAKRKIPIPSTQENLVLMFDRKEIMELQTIFLDEGNVYEKKLRTGDIDYTLILN